MKLNFLLLVVLFLAKVVFAQVKKSTPSGPPLVEISPRGNIESVEQIQVRFLKPMLALGDQQSETNPVNSECLKGGSGYWIDPQNWVYNFTNPPPPGHTCVVSSRSGLRTLDGTNIPSTTIEFETLSAQIILLAPHYEVDPEQYFALMTNGPVSDDWIQKNVYFTVEGLGDRIPPQIISGKEKEQIFQSASENNHLFKVNPSLPEEQSRRVVLKSSQRFPRSGTVVLHWIKDYSFTVAPAFKVTFSCERENANEGCIPLSSMSLDFTDEVSGSVARTIYLIGKDQKKVFGELNEIPEKGTTSRIVFKGPFAPESDYTVVLKAIRSTNGEALENQQQFPLKVRTASLPSLLKFERSLSVLEASQPFLPVTVRSVENPVLGQSHFQNLPLTGTKAQFNFQNLAQIFAIFRDLPWEPTNIPMKGLSKTPFQMEVKKISVKKNFPPEKTEVVGLPLPGKGFYVFELKSRRLGLKFNDPADIKENKKDYFVRSAALVTNLNLTLKASPREVLVWVTSLDQGRPQEQVKVQLYSPTAKLIKESFTDSRGLAFFQLTESENNALHVSRPEKYDRGFFAVAQKSDDFAFIYSDDETGLNKYRFGIQVPDRDPENIYHALLEKHLLQPGETLNAKLIYRHLERRGLSIPKLKLPNQIQITSHLNQRRFLVPVKWYPEVGTGIIMWKIPEMITLGTYSISFPQMESQTKSPRQIGDGEEPEVELNADSQQVPFFGNIVLREFKTPTLISSLRALGAPWLRGQTPQIEFSANYLSGGPAAGLPVQIKYSLAKDEIHIEDEEYSLFNWQKGIVLEGIKKLDEVVDEQSQPQQNQLQVKLDQFGRIAVELKGLKDSLTPQRVVVEVSYKDSNGEVQTVSRGYPLLRSPWILGIKPGSWMMTGEKFDVEAALLNLKHEAIEGREVTFSLYQQQIYSTRKKLLGGFYSYESFQEIRKLKEICRIKTNGEGRAHCHYSDSKLNGQYLVLAEAKDEKGLTLSTQVLSFVSGGRNWADSENSDRMDLIPFKKKYEPGETAEFHVRAPISEGKLLLTVERDHILHQEVIDFDSGQPVIKLKIQEDWAPNVIVSAVLIRGRIPGKVSGVLDLGRPALKMGLTLIRIGLHHHTLQVKVKTDRERYEPRQVIKAEINVADSEGRPVQGEVAVAAVDEALLALSPNPTWDLVERFFPLRAHQFEVAYLISQVLGKRTLGLKAVPLGGDGGAAPHRELFDTSLFWNPRVKVINGKARVEFKANDSLTAFRLVAVAMSGTDKFGSGTSTLRVDKEVQTFSGLALAVRKGDNYSARFNVRNSTGNKINLIANLKLNGKKLEPQALSLGAGVTQEIQWAVGATGVSENVFEMTLIDDRGKVLDSILIRQPVQDVWAVRPVASVLQQGIDSVIPLKRPPHATKTLVQATVLPSLASEIPGLKKYWELYPFNCFEQKLSRAISMDSAKLFKELSNNAETYQDQDGFLKFFAKSPRGSVYLTNYVFQILFYRGWKLESRVEQAALKALKGFFNGTLKGPDYTNGTDLDLLRLQTLDTLTLYGQASGGMFATLKLQLETLSNHDLAHALSIFIHDKTIPGQKETLKQALQIMRSRAVLSSGRLTLKNAIALEGNRMYTDEDITFAKVLLQVLEQPLFQEDGGRLILSFMEQMTNGAWKGTMANAWGRLALSKYQELFEKTSVRGLVNWGLRTEDPTQLKKLSQRIEQKLLIGEWPLLSGGQFEGHFEGQGKPWWSILVLADVRPTENINHGIAIEKIWKPIQVKNPNQKTVGDIWEVALNIHSKSQFQWLALQDPLPPGASILEEQGVEISEKRALDYRIFQSWFDGKGVYSYKIRLNQPGHFTLPTTRGEPMYNSDVYGEILNGQFDVFP